MCGIAGLWGPEAARKTGHMTRRLAHRGPDDEGVWVSPTHPLALGNRRLKILDLSDRGHQPMVSRSGKIVLTYNGEIFNQAEVRRTLEAEGYAFKSSSDTEVVLEALDLWWDQAVERLKGMFAFAAWNRETSTLLMARDRLGIKPLYYCQKGDQLAFASEVTALLSSEIIRPELDAANLPSYLRLLWLPEPTTLFKGVVKLEPGTLAEWNGESLRIRRYWDVPGPSDRIVEPGQLQEALRAAVHSQLHSDVPVGAFLSGGVDSSAIVALAAEAGASIHTYSIGFSKADRKRSDDLDDLHFARLVAERFGTRHREIVLTPDVVSLLPKLVRHLEDPIADPAAINAYLICEAARETSTVLLSGAGGDELFGGYSKYVATMLGEHYQRVPRLLRDGLIEPLVGRAPLAVAGRGVRVARQARRFLKHGHLSAFDRFLGYSTYYDADELGDLLVGTPTLEPYAGVESLKQAWDRRGGDELVDRMTYVDMKYYLPGLGLAYMDKASMAASVEVRVPLIDDDIVDLVAPLPGSRKLRSTRTKIALKEAVSPLLPREIIRRPKAPFTAPVRSWLRGELSPVVREYLGREIVTRRGLFEPDAVERILLENERGEEDHSLRIWALLTLEVWLREFIDAPRPSSDDGSIGVEITTGGGHATTGA